MVQERGKKKKERGANERTNEIIVESLKRAIKFVLSPMAQKKEKTEIQVQGWGRRKKDIWKTMR